MKHPMLSLLLMLILVGVAAERIGVSLKLQEAEDRVAYLEGRLGLRERSATVSQVSSVWRVYYDTRLRFVKAARYQLLVTKYIQTVAPQTDEETTAQIVQSVVKYSLQKGVGVRDVVAMMQQESWFNPSAVGPAGERGLMQLTPTVAAMYGVPWSQAFDIDQNIRAGVSYYADQHRRHGTREAALHRYNGSAAYIGQVERRLKSLLRFETKVQLM